MKVIKTQLKGKRKWAAGPADHNRVESLCAEQVEHECQRTWISAKGQYSSYWALQQVDLLKVMIFEKVPLVWKMNFCPVILLNYQKKNYQLNQDKMNFSTLRNIQALFAPLKLQTEFKAGQQVKPLPFPPSSTLSLDILRGNDETIWRRQWQPTPVLLPGKSHGQRSLVGCSPWGC